MRQTPFLTGQFLLAMPGIGDPRFERAIIAMCAHDANGALGIGLGHLLPGVRLHQLLAQFEIDCADVPDTPVHLGGPVEPQRGFVIHSADWSGQDSIEVAGRWMLTGTLDVLRVIGHKAGPSRWAVALGYAGWDPGQLDGEMLRHGWHVTPGNETLLFDTPTEDRWASAFRADGIDPALLASASGTA